MDRMHMQEVTIAYGMTETSPVSFRGATDEQGRARIEQGAPRIRRFIAGPSATAFLRQYE